MFRILDFNISKFRFVRVRNGVVMKKILVSGFFACFLAAIVYFFFRFIVVDGLAPLFRPLILRLSTQEYLVIPLTLVFTFIIIVIVGSVVTRIKLGGLYNRYIRRVPQNIQKGRGALVAFSPGTYYLGIIIKEIDFMKSSGEVSKHYVLYCPSVPLPWTGLPVIFVEKDKVTPLKLSYGELYSILGSFGTNTPSLLRELKTENTEFF